MSKKILLALQFWNGDKDQAMRLARTIADMQPGRCDNADFLFMSRFDCTQDAPTIQEVSRKFNVFQAVSRRRGTGWPHGCNDLWFGTLDHIYSKTVARQMPEYKAILTFEADCAPTASNWVNELHRAWDLAAPAQIVGSLIPGKDGGHDHINGNMMFTGDLAALKWVTRDVGGCHARGGWDYLLAPQFKKRGWADCPGMRSDYRMETMTREYFEHLITSGVFFHHGCKDGSSLALVQERFVN